MRRCGQFLRATMAVACFSWRWASTGARPMLGAGCGLVALGSALAATPVPAGRTFISHYTPRDYQGHNQIFALAEDANGVIYLSNRGAVLAYDGERWDRVRVPTTWIRDLHATADGRVFVAGTDEFGWCEHDPATGLSYHSLNDRLPAGTPALGGVWSVAGEANRTYFATSTDVWRWDGQQLQGWNFPPATRAYLGRIGSRLLLFRSGQGLFELSSETWQRIGPPDTFAEAVRLIMIDQGPQGIVLIDPAGNRWRLRDSATLTKESWSQPVAALLHDANIVAGIGLRDGSVALSTAKQGVVVVHADRQTCEHYNPANGYDTPLSYQLLEDRTGGLWVGHQQGAARIDRGQGYSVFDALSGKDAGNLADVVLHQGDAYTYSIRRVYRLAPGPAPGSPGLLEPIDLPTESIWVIASHPRGLLIGADNGLFLYAGGTSTRIAAVPEGAIALGWRPETPDDILVGTVQGLREVRFHGDTITLSQPWAEAAGEVRTIFFADSQTVWLGTTTRGFVRLQDDAPPGAGASAPADRWRQATITAFDTTHGLPADPGWSFVVPGATGLVFATKHGVFAFDAATATFRRDARWALPDHPEFAIEPFAADRHGTIWLQATDPDNPGNFRLGGLTVPADGPPRWQPLPRRLLQRAGYDGAKAISWLPDPADPKGPGSLWLGGTDALVRVDLGANPATPQTVAAPLVRAYSGPRQAGARGNAANLHFTHGATPITFAFAAPHFDATAGHVYQYRLVGFNSDWSDWSARNEASFTNLPGGTFRFEVRARDPDDHLSAIARLTFAVDPPWHLSSPALLVYGGLGLALFYGLLKWRLRSSERERVRLETLVAERTLQLAEAKDEADAANRAKSTFLANMSHELRTPLNGVIGYAQVLLKDRELTPRNRERVNVVARSGEHLLRMINEVLDFSKIEAGKLELRPAPLNLPALLRDIAANLQPRAEARQLRFHLDLAPQLPVQVIGDAQKLRQVIENLLGNAIKFTPAGSITLQAAPVPTAPRHIAFRVTDTGVGLSPADQAQLFTPFHQAVDARPPEPGTGLGLSISQRLVELMGGSISVESTVGAGSTFAFALPFEELDALVPESDPAPSSIIGYDGPRRSLLVIDDVAVNRTLLEELLGPLGFSVTPAPDGDAAWATLEAGATPPDGIILDLRMPGIDGLELTRRIRARWGAQPKIILMSASVLAFDPQTALDAGCDDFLPKPFRETELLERLGRALKLSWRHADGPTTAVAPAGPIAAMAPAAVLANLRECARRGDIRGLRDQLSRLPADEPGARALRQTLQPLIASYHMDQIRRVLAPDP